MPNIYIDQTRLMNDLMAEATKIFQDCAEQFREQIREELPLDHTTAPNEWKQEIIDNIDVQNIAAGGNAITADIGLFYNQLYQRVRAGVIDQGMKGVPVHIPGKTVWTNIDVNGQRVEHLIAPLTTSGDSAAFEMPGFQHSGTHFWENAVRRLKTYFDLRVAFFWDDFDIKKYIVVV